jgi:hypothetical protein
VKRERQQLYNHSLQIQDKGDEKDLIIRLSEAAQRMTGIGRGE